ncbi:YiiX/YebB-like N1pC/P60 family cysteine hydrolase [Bacillus halotolerans]|uniref:YiiX/YebB-like N1pC/P60 family cysteine hydrolase n=1 Tax=Bacillus halotolerans TaxID=260554 RepID=UPI002DB8639A|nr:YiiX/YebB-like N1pC/P60 family cysteine hydrolase [Bacillus halotolerans]MEC3637391.1 YiiX/YebB-like N1pC/P60 family cysteine hydrolase [Bacillus halotolerans]
MSIKGKMFIILVALTISGGLFISPAKAVKATNYAEEIAALQPGTTPEEITKSASQIAKQQHVKTNVILKQFYQEITADKAEGDQLAKESGMSVMGGSSGTKKLPTSTKGNIYYTNSYTAYYNHGHVGMYSAADKIVESVPSDGVRQIAYNARDVEDNSIVQTVNVTSSKKTSAADWAVSRVGDPYSFNFVNNRNTGHDGAKNCSKLLWSAFLLKAGIDIDSNKGLGVYPRDITSSSYTTTVMTIH